jgi:thiamine kinase-like enzyme
MVCDPESGYYRLFPFIEDSRSFNVVHTPGQAHEASKQFALFTKLLSGFDVGMLKTTIPDFHNLSFRYEQFTEALSNGNPKRMQESSALIRFLIKQNTILRTYEMILRHPDFKRRVMHHDTKISNVLFNSENKALCLIDLDTVMPGYFISDVGDMLRTYLSPAGEEEDDFQKIQIREDFFEAILSGYLLELQDSLTKAEKAHFLYAGKFMIYMQALRFLTDYLNNDAYYKTNYEGHNLIRAQNQSVLLQRLLEKEPGLNKIINNVLSLTRS